MSKLGRKGWRRCGALLLSIALFCAGSLPVSAETLSELREKQEVLAAQKEENDAALEKLKDDTARKKAYRDALYQQIDTVQQQLDVFRWQIGDLNEQIAQMEDRISGRQAAIDQNMDLLKERIRALYVTGDATTISLVLNSRDLMDFTEKVQILKAITRHDQQLIDTLTGQIEEIEDDLAEINRDKMELSERKKEMESKSAELIELYEEAGRLVDDAENQEWNAKANSEVLGSQLEENEAAIAQLEEEIRQQGTSLGSGYVGTGSFQWPMPGYTYLTCYFGEGGHRGIDIAGGDIYGKPIVAADGGTVIYAGWNDSYGYCVFLDHGNGFETRYAHMSELGTETGAAIDQGQIIGYVGSTGNSTGPHLHFEVIYEDSLTDPMGYF